MRTTTFAIVSLVALTTEAFTVLPSSRVSSTTTALSASMSEIRKSIDGLSSSNAADQLAVIEPYLVNEAGTTFLKKSLKRIAVKASKEGFTVPDGFAAEAKATAKRREKQDAFIATKEEERLAAEAADAPEEEATEAADEAAPVEA